MFDLIIANPPYGKNSTLATKIINQLHVHAREVCVLATQVAFKGFGHWKDVSKVDYLKVKMFEDADFSSRLTVVCIKSKNEKVLVRDYKDFVLLDLPDLQVWNKVNDSKPAVAKCKWLSVPSTIPDEDFKKITDNFDRSRCFVQTAWNLRNNVHSENGGAFDVEFNVHDKDWFKAAQSVYIFKTKQERDNFCYWYYHTAWEREDSLIRWLLTLFNTARFADVGDWIPHINWNKEGMSKEGYTDEYVLKELGLKWKDENDPKKGVEAVLS